MSRNPVRVFTYGTLQPGERAGYMLARFPGERATVDGWTCYAPDGYGFPLVAKGAGTVPGHCYTVSPDVLPQLDRYEGVPTMYRRATVSVRLESGATVPAILYRWVGPIPPGIQLPSGVRWTGADSRRAELSCTARPRV